ncbi:Carnitine O-acetyltransferase, mitochondrial [Smittium culicis]|uniref:Carnitine O-acetyltransferase, mitochondrial n=1 Tax=Smittium culicis TaxID=133412 RepID=A0A1R1XL83_9FUNG|nr:Carnitine O-acetyltransferase, mitochondrial [Smittium culicis]
MSSLQKTFQHQATLPRLPIPPTEHTFQQYLESLIPVLSPEELENTKAVIRELTSPVSNSKSIADILQDRLKAYDSTQQHHWLERLWEDIAYLSWREPLYINSNYWITFIKDKNAYGQIEDPKFAQIAKSLSRQEKQKLVCLGAGFSQYQIRLSAAIANRCFDYYHLVLNEELAVEKAGANPICMNQYKSLFGVTRLPRPECDVISRYQGHISSFILMAKNQIFSVPLYTKNGNRILDGDLEDLISSAITKVSTMDSSKLEPPICLLTAGHRDRWSVGYSLLANEKNPISLNTLQEIQKSAFVISLEDFYSPKSAGEGAWQRLVKSGGKNGHNRWFDKHINYVIDRNGNLGAVGEHSPADAVVPAKLHDYVITRVLINPDPNSIITENSVSPSVFRKNSNCMSSYPQYKNDSIPKEPVHLLFGEVDPMINTLIDETQAEVDRLEYTSVSDTLIINQYGGQFMKSAKISPDSYVQLMLQLTYYKLHNEVAPTYESGSTRSFSHGRTDTIRSLTQASKEFVETMLNPKASDLDKYKMFIKAGSVQSKNAKAVSTGLGIDRHLLGLRFANYKLAPLPGEPKFDQSIADKFFSDAGMSKSSNYTLSTSGLFPNHTLVHTGFGVTVPKNGYGMNYTIMPDFVKIGVETKRNIESFGQTDVFRFLDEFQNSFAEMKLICLNALAAKSKL